jgi:hypothetical protein
LVVSPVRVVTNCGSWSGARSTGFSRSSPWGRGRGASTVGGGVIYATYQRQFYVKLISPSPFEGWVAEGSEVPPRAT